MTTPAYFGEAFSFTFTEQTITVRIQDLASGSPVVRAVITLPMPAAKVLSVALRAMVTGAEAKQQNEFYVNQEVWVKLGELGVAPGDWPKPLNIPENP